MTCKNKKQTVPVVLLHPEAKLPEYKTAGAAAADVRALAWQGVSGEWHYDLPCLIAPGQAIAFRTGLSFEVPEGYELKAYSRSGHGFNQGIRLANCTGILDSDYRGELLVKLHNDSENVFQINPSDRIAQVQVQEAIQHEFVQVSELSTTERGEGGLGHTGNK